MEDVDEDEDSMGVVEFDAPENDEDEEQQEGKLAVEVEHKNEEATEGKKSKSPMKRMPTHKLLVVDLPAHDEHDNATTLKSGEKAKKVATHHIVEDMLRIDNLEEKEEEEEDTQDVSPHKQHKASPSPAPRGPAHSPTVGSSSNTPSPSPRARRRRDDTGEASFVVGDEIEARYKGKDKWYPGRISRVWRDGKHVDVAYDDGDSERRVANTLIRRRQDREDGGGGGGGGDDAAVLVSTPVSSSSRAKATTPSSSVREKEKERLESDLHRARQQIADLLRSQGEGEANDAAALIQTRESLRAAHDNAARLEDEKAADARRAAADLATLGTKLAQAEAAQQRAEVRARQLQLDNDRLASAPDVETVAIKAASSRAAAAEARAAAVEESAEGQAHRIEVMAAKLEAVRRDKAAAEAALLRGEEEHKHDVAAIRLQVEAAKRLARDQAAAAAAAAAAADVAAAAAAERGAELLSEARQERSRVALELAAAKGELETRSIALRLAEAETARGVAALKKERDAREGDRRHLSERLRAALQAAADAKTQKQQVETRLAAEVGKGKALASALEAERGLQAGKQGSELTHARDLAVAKEETLAVRAEAEAARREVARLEEILSRANSDREEFRLQLEERRNVIAALERDRAALVASKERLEGSRLAAEHALEDAKSGIVQLKSEMQASTARVRRANAAREKAEADARAARQEREDALTRARGSDTTELSLRRRIGEAVQAKKAVEEMLQQMEAKFAGRDEATQRRVGEIAQLRSALAEADARERDAGKTHDAAVAEIEERHARELGDQLARLRRAETEARESSRRANTAEAAARRGDAGLVDAQADAKRAAAQARAASDDCEAAERRARHAKQALGRSEDEAAALRAELQRAKAGRDEAEVEATALRGKVQRRDAALKDAQRRLAKVMATMPSSAVAVAEPRPGRPTAGAGLRVAQGQGQGQVQGHGYGHGHGQGRGHELGLEFGPGENQQYQPQQGQGGMGTSIAPQRMAATQRPGAAAIAEHVQAQAPAAAMRFTAPVAAAPRGGFRHVVDRNVRPPEAVAAPRTNAGPSSSGDGRRIGWAEGAATALGVGGREREAAAGGGVQRRRFAPRDEPTSSTAAALRRVRAAQEQFNMPNSGEAKEAVPQSSSSSSSSFTTTTTSTWHGTAARSRRPADRNKAARTDLKRRQMELEQARQQWRRAARETNSIADSVERQRQRDGLKAEKRALDVAAVQLNVDIRQYKTDVLMRRDGGGGGGSENVGVASSSSRRSNPNAKAPLGISRQASNKNMMVERMPTHKLLVVDLPAHDAHDNATTLSGVARRSGGGGDGGERGERMDTHHIVENMLRIDAAAGDGHGHDGTRRTMPRSATSPAAARLASPSPAQAPRRPNRGGVVVDQLSVIRDDEF